VNNPHIWPVGLWLLVESFDQRVVFMKPQQAQPMRNLDVILCLAFIWEGNSTDAQRCANFGVELTFQASQLHRLLVRYHAG
jgi:hypothetical protein